MLTEINESTWNNDVFNQPTPVVVLFVQPYLAPCQQMMDYLDNIALKLGPKIRIVQMDIDENPEMAQKLSVRRTPTTMIYAGGRNIGIKTGPIPEADLETWVTSVTR